MTVPFYMHELNPDWEAARKHGEASKTGREIDTTPAGTANIETCPCCHEVIQKQRVSLWVHSKQLEFLGFGFPLFYQFLKLCIFMLVITIGCYHAFSLKQGIVHNITECQRLLHESDHEYHKTNRLLSGDGESMAGCTVFSIQMSRIQIKYSRQEEVLRSLSFVIQLLALMYIRNGLTKLEANYDERTTTLSDYSLIIKGISLKEGVRKRIINFMAKQVGPDKPNIQEIILLPNLQDLGKLKQKRFDLINELRPFYKKDELDEKDKRFVQLQTQFKIQNQLIMEKGYQTLEKINKDNQACERAIVIFNKQEDQLSVLQTVESVSQETLGQYFGTDMKVLFQPAPEPEQIIWKNVSLTLKERIGRIILGWFLSVVILIMVFLVFYFILIQKALLLQNVLEQLAEHPDDPNNLVQYNGAIALAYFLMFFIVLFDKIILSTLFHKFTQLERHSTSANFQFSFSFKYSLGLFFTTALMTLATEAIHFNNYYHNEYGVINEETIMFLMNAIFIPLFWLINPSRLFRILKRKFQEGKKHFTQKEANKLMEEEPYDLGKRFAEIIEMMWFVYLYSTLLPIGAVIICAGLIFYYWVDKYNLLRRSKVRGKISGDFIATSLTMLDLTLILRPLGSLIFDSQIRQGNYFISNIVMLCVGIAYMILPKDMIIDLLNKENFKPEEKEYKEVKHKFHKTYETEHPLFGIMDQQTLNHHRVQNFSYLCDKEVGTCKKQDPNSFLIFCEEVNQSSSGKETSHLFIHDKTNNF